MFFVGYEWNITLTKIPSKNVYKYILLKTNAQVSIQEKKIFEKKYKILM